MKKTKEIFQIVSSFFHAHHKLSIGLILIEFLIVGISIVTLYNQSQILDYLQLAVSGQTSFGNKIFLRLGLQVLLLIISLLSKTALTYLQQRFHNKTGLESKLSFFKTLLSIIGVREFEISSNQDTFQMGLRGIEFSRSEIFLIILNLAKNITVSIAFSYVLVSKYPLVTIVALVVSLPVLLVGRQNSRTEVLFKITNSKTQRFINYLSGLFISPYFSKDIRIFGLQTYFLDKYKTLQSELLRAEEARDRRVLVANMSGQLIIDLSSSLLSVYCIISIIYNRMTLGAMNLLLGAFSQIQSAIQQIFLNYNSLDLAMLYYQKYKETVAISQKPIITFPYRDIPKLSKGLAFKNVHFKYSQNQPWILNGINFFIPKGTTYFIVGSNGAGKSTIIKLILRLYDPDLGSILWDGIDIREFDPHKFREGISTLSQDFSHFDLSVRENIGIGDVNKFTGSINSDNEIREAASRARLINKIVGLKNGLDTVLSTWMGDNDEGMELSGGEWKKVALSRIYFRNRDIVIFDEPTTNLDKSAKAAFYFELAKFRQIKTQIVVSHDQEIDRQLFNVLNLENGIIKNS